MERYPVTIEDSTKNFTGGYNYGCVGHRFVRVVVRAENESVAQVEALKIVSAMNQTPSDFLAIAII